MEEGGGFCGGKLGRGEGRIRNGREGVENRASWSCHGI